MYRHVLLTIFLVVMFTFIIWAALNGSASGYYAPPPTSGVTSTISPSCTPTMASPVVTNTGISGSTPTDTPIPAQIGTPASANNISSPNAGASASVTAPTGAPDTSLRR